MAGCVCLCACNVHLTRKTYFFNLWNVSIVFVWTYFHGKCCLSPVQAAEIVWRNSGCQSATNTAVARTSILGIHYYNAHSKVMHNALEICNTTHPDPRYEGHLSLAEFSRVGTIFDIFGKFWKTGVLFTRPGKSGAKVVERFFFLKKKWMPNDWW